MCGIYCYVGKKKAVPILTEGLSTLEYRGYDSAGIAYVSNNKVNIFKEKGKLENLIKTLDNETDTYIGIGHTRWATHGSPNKINAHPHRCGKITLVHNGIIENYEDIKNELKYDFKSETDSEVLACLINKLYEEKNNIIDALDEIKNIVKGSYALGILVDDLDGIYATRKDSPIILAKSDVGSFIASDIPAILKYTNKYILLDNYEIAHLTIDNIEIYKNKEPINKKEYIFEGNFESACKNGYEHFMLKEIYEQSDVIAKTIELNAIPDLSKYNKIHIVACGSAYHAGLIGKDAFEKYCDIETNVYLASEYRYQKNFYDEKTLVIFISQSGETADTLACVRKLNNVDTLGIINVVSSSIARETQNVIYTKAGCEIAVATTKAYLSQIATLILIALKNSKIIDKDILNDNINSIVADIDEILNIDVKEIAKVVSNYNDIFFIGRDVDYYICQEGSLKLKEISYIHSEAYAAGELKHGTISLIDENSLVIAISTVDELNEKIISNIKEVKSRGCKVIYITTKKLDKESNFYDEKIVIPNNLYFQPLLSVIPLQLLSYYVAKERNCDIDKPKNLAKSVTVE